ncbi:MAG: dihydrofolate reductase family protein [Theionarchaea archaeon]|nr:dihydrofolate reductase family protein [Theionarchaea archaeon]
MNSEKDIIPVRDPSRVETTLLLLMSVDGKITSGETDNLNSDRDWKRMRGVKEGINQYYEIEWSIAVNSLSTGRIMEKIGINSRTEIPEKDNRLTFFIIDRKPHLNENGVRYVAQWVGRLFIVTNNPSHPAFALKSDYENVEVILYPEDIDLKDLLRKMKQTYGIEHLTIETGGTLNAVLLQQGLIDHVMVIVAPLLVWGRNTSSLIDGPSLRTEEDLVNLKALKLVKCEVLEGSYLLLEYDVINETIIDPKPC